MDHANETAAILRDLARAKVLFQARAIAAFMGAPPPSPTHDIGKDG